MTILLANFYSLYIMRQLLLYFLYCNIILDGPYARFYHDDNNDSFDFLNRIIPFRLYDFYALRIATCNKPIYFDIFKWPISRY